ncbi:MAG: nucleotide exchange factor GrpE [Flavobacteriaceae bacterium]|nr:nucleotide exchange factor GrpE [Flavobacteriaceae bacterium]MDG2314808.1 nucleotide exchange factor GrpE [Flavobacteriaceae bacterium]
MTQAKKAKAKKAKESKVEKKTTTNNDQVAELQAQIDQEKEKFLRLFAEFENYKKRTSKERLELYKTANQEVIGALLPVMDDFDRAMIEISKSENQELVKGVSLIQNKLVETLKNQGLIKSEVNKGDLFDAEIHEAITQIPAPEESLKGAVIDVVESGYALGDKIIRYPKVVVGN